VAELIDIRTRRVLWRIPARATRQWTQSLPAIRGDGRYALVSVPPEEGASKLPIALVDMRNGRIVQRVAPFSVGGYPQSLGFTADGRRAWVAAANFVYFYSLRGR